MNRYEYRAAWLAKVRRRERIDRFIRVSWPVVVFVIVALILLWGEW